MNPRTSQLLPASARAVAVIALMALILPVRAVSAEQASIQGPALGFVFDDASRSLRPVLGLPGAAITGGIMTIDRPVRGMEVAPARDYALAIDAEAGTAGLIRLDREPLSMVPLPGLDPLPRRMVISPSGLSAAFIYDGPPRVRLVTGLPLDPTVVAEIDASAMTLPATVALSDDSRAVLLASAEGNNTPMFAWSPEGGLRFLATFGSISDLRFVTGTHDAVLADPTTNEIILIRDAVNSAEVSVLAGQRDGISNPSFVEASSDGSWFFAINSGSSEVVRIARSGGALDRLLCPCAPSGLHRMNGESVFRLTGVSAAPMWLVDAGAPEPRVIFVPPSVDSAAPRSEPLP